MSAERDEVRAQDLLVVLGLPLRLERLDHFVDLVLGDEAALDALGLGVLRLREQQVTQADKVLGARRVEDDAGVDARRHVERDAVGDVRFDQAGHDVGGRTLRGDDQVDARRARELRDAADGELHLLADVHHEVGKLVDDDDDVGQFLLKVRGNLRPIERVLGGALPCGRGGLGVSVGFLDLGVVLADIARAHL